MTWLEIFFTVDRSAVETAEETLERLGALAITLLDDADQAVLEPGPGSTPLWPVVQVKGLFESTVDRQWLLAQLQGIPGVDRPGRISWAEVGDRDWERAWMERFEPMRFGQRLWIVPSGMAIGRAPENVEIKLDPGLAFGTGTHPTTALCLEWLDGQDVTGQTLVDYGCGSGILGIAAALLGAAEVHCVDNDPQALEATAANSARNGVADRVHCHSPETFSVDQADVVLANILAGPLIDLATVLTGCARPGARIVLSGLLEDQLKEVTSAYLEACAVQHAEIREGWARLDLKKHS
jgi:ribosomal protein L11 methyltransferase